MDILSWLWARAQEPSTWAGVAAVASAFHIDPSIVTNVKSLVIAGGGLLAVILPEATKAAVTANAKK
jgi:hypothetical protein